MIFACASVCVCECVWPVDWITWDHHHIKKIKKNSLQTVYKACLIISVPFIINCVLVLFLSFVQFSFTLFSFSGWFVLFQFCPHCQSSWVNVVYSLPPCPTQPISSLIPLFTHYFAKIHSSERKWNICYPHRHLINLILLKIHLNKNKLLEC